jgi:hypothetical protein
MSIQTPRVYKIIKSLSFNIWNSDLDDFNFLIGGFGLHAFLSLVFELLLFSNNSIFLTAKLSSLFLLQYTLEVTGLLL